MLDFGFYNMDCMDGMKEFPDQFFDLAIVDPPYGDAGGVARKTEISPRHITSGRIAENRTEHGVMRTGGTWATKYAKKLLRGTLPRNKNILMNCFASHETRLSGGATILIYLRHGVF